MVAHPTQPSVHTKAELPEPAEAPSIHHTLLRLFYPVPSANTINPDAPAHAEPAHPLNGTNKNVQPQPDQQAGAGRRARQARTGAQGRAGASAARRRELNARAPRARARCRRSPSSCSAGHHTANIDQAAIFAPAPLRPPGLAACQPWRYGCCNRSSGRTSMICNSTVAMSAEYGDEHATNGRRRDLPVFKGFSPASSRQGANTNGQHSGAPL